AEFAGHDFDRVDRSAIDVRLAEYPQSGVGRRDAVTAEQARQRGGAAVHRGSLDHFFNPAAGLARSCERFVFRRHAQSMRGIQRATPWAATPTICSMGVARPTSISTTTGSPYARLPASLPATLSADSTRTHPLRGSGERLATRAGHPTSPRRTFALAGRTQARCPGWMKPTACPGEYSATARSDPAGTIHASVSPASAWEPGVASAIRTTRPATGATIVRRASIHRARSAAP